MEYVIADYEFEIKGRTRPHALIYNGEFKTGEKIRGQADLDKYISDKTQMLTNQRVLKDNVVITPSVGEQNEDGTFPVTLFISVEDTWNFIILPYPKYKSDSGFDLTVKARDYNFLGTMNPLRVDLGYIYNEKHQSTFKLEVYSDTPFEAFGYTWNLRFDNQFWYRSDIEQPFFYRNVTGLSMELPFRTTTFTFGFEEYITLNEENSDGQKAIYGLDFQDGPYMTSRMYTSWKIPTGLTVSRYGELTYTPEVSATFNHEISEELHNFRKGPFLGFSHSLGFEKIDWHSNYRDGLSVSLDNTYTYDIFRLRDDVNPFFITSSATGTGYFIISEWFGISTRLKFRHWFCHKPDYYEEAADIIRGIADRAINADYMLSLNMDFPFRILLFKPSKWSSLKTKFFDLEFQISPIIDMALYHDPNNDVSFNPKNILVAGGGELIIFSDFMRNLYARFCVSWNLRELVSSKKFPSGNDRELSFTIGHFY